MIENSTVKLKTGCVTCDEILSQHHVFNFFSFFLFIPLFVSCFSLLVIYLVRWAILFISHNWASSYEIIENAAVDNSEGSKR